MADLPLHDATRDLLFMAETRTAEATLNKRLDRLRSEFPPRPAAPPSLPGLPAGRRHSDRALVARPACAVGTDARRACARARRLEVEQARSDDLLYSMLPRPVVEDLRDGRRARGAYEDMV
jgi:hypothetical protein